MKRLFYLTLLITSGISLHADATDRPARTRSGLLALYDFVAPNETAVQDRSGVGQAFDLRISDPAAARQTPKGLEVRGKTIVQSAQPATKIVRAVQRSGAVTIEAWLRPGRLDQSGPARIVTLSRNSSERNFTLGQDGNRFDVRLRTSKTSKNGIPSLSTPPGSVRSQRTHFVYTHARNGRTRMFLDGKQVLEKQLAGQTDNWDDSFSLALANELSGDRPWEGTLYLVAIYGRELSVAEVRANFAAGPTTRSMEELVQNHKRNLFETKIAPLLSNHCLECHDDSTRQGGLVLSTKAGALAGGENGKAIVPGKLSASLLWDYIESGEMPKKRPPLSPEEQQLLKQWINDGATWSLEKIDPAIYAHGSQSQSVWVQRLTQSEYIATVKAAVDVDIATEARELLPPDLRADGFSNTAYNLSVDLKHIEAYARLAEIIASRIEILKFAGRFSKSRKLSTDATMRDFVADMGKWILRGPLSDREITNYSGIATSVASAGGNYEEAVRFILEAMLQSPRFIYRLENQRGDGSRWPASSYELATRISYILWGAPPDKELMRAADQGKLDRQGVEQQVKRMLQDRRAVGRSLEFFAEWLNLRRLENMNPNRIRYPDWSPELAADMRAETLAYCEHVVWQQQRPLADLLNAQVTFLTPRLARHYGLPPQAEGLQRIDLTKIPSRGGLLTQGSVLTIGGDNASMVSRGLFVFHDLLRGIVKDPPPCVDTTPVPTKAGLTQRSIAEARIANSNCGGCHAKFEPLAFGLEKFDGLGAYRDQDAHANPLREDGQILFPGTAKPLHYKTSAELMQLLAKSTRVQESITWKLTQFALGRPLAAADAPLVRQVHARAQADGGTYANLITAIVTSDLVMTTNTEMDP